MLLSNNYHLYLFGSPRLIRDDQVDVSPRMLKSKCLLAFLALRQGAPTERARLQDLLWSTRSAKCGRDSLKKALSDIRKCFSDDEGDPLLTAGGPVSLDISSITVDVINAPSFATLVFDQPEFLEGVDLPDDPFNDWVRKIRLNLTCRQHHPNARPAAADVTPTSNLAGRPNQLFELAILEPVTLSTDLIATHLGNLLSNAVVSQAQECGFYNCYDWRSNSMTEHPRSRGGDVLLSVQTTSLKDEVLFGFSARQVGTDRLIWSQNHTLLTHELSEARLEMIASRAIDQLSERLLRFDGFGTDEHLAAREVLSAIDHIFRLSNQDLEIAEELLHSAIEKQECSVFYAWLAHLSAFQAEKGGRIATPHLLEKTREFANRALELDRHNPMTVALVAHAQSFVLRDLETACELIAEVGDRAQQNPFLADTMSMVEFYQGDYRAAHKLAVMATTAGRFSPYRYTFTTSVAMSNLMLGNYKTAIQNAKKAVVQHPVIGGHVYEPALRTLAASYSLDGQMENGRGAMKKLMSQDRSFDLDRLKSTEDAPFPNPEVLEVVRTGLERLHA